ncbi:MAG: meta-cleavage compound hydrolase [Chloroflexota bacterium]|nr:meta-cleavage compound hydrolase [Chloroflexota bacterium]
MIIDMHGHWMSPGLREFFWQTVSLRNISDSAKPFRGIDEENETNIKCMDERGIDLQILSIRPVSMLHNENPYISIPWARVFNNALAEGVSRRHDRLRGMATLPQADLSASVEELERGVKELGMVGAIVNPNPKGNESMEPLDDPYWEPLWEKAVELDVPLFIHGAYLESPRFLRHRSAYLVGQTVEETISGPTLVYGGVLLKYPTLKLILCHGGGATPYQIGRYLTPPGRDEAGMYGSPKIGSFLDEFRKLYFDGTLYTTEALELLIKVVGPDRVLFGTETPGRGTFQYQGRMLDDLRPAVEGIEWLRPDQKKQILEDNARSVFKITDA